MHTAHYITATCLSFSLIVTGCVTYDLPNDEWPLTSSREEVLEYIEFTSPCCLSPRDFKYVELTPPQKKFTYLHLGEPVYRFETGKSLFNAFHISQESNTPVEVTIRSITFSDRNTSGSNVVTIAVFRPVVATLNKDYQVVRLFDSEVFRLVRADWDTAESYEFTFTLERPDEVGFVVYTTPSLVESSSPGFKSSDSLNVIGSVVAPSFDIERGGSYPNYPMGWLKVTVR